VAPEIARREQSAPRPSVTLGVTAVFSALIAVGTMIIIPLPKPLAEITLAPAIYLSLAALSDRWTAFNATAIGSFIGETVNGALYGYPLIYSFGIVWARAPEAFIVAWAAKKGTRALALAMIGATVFETLAFYFSDAAFYAFGLFGYCTGVDNCLGFTNGLILALPDIATMADLLFIPVALAIIVRAGPAFRRLGFQ
jgi:uncharacterized membrane protein